MTTNRCALCGHPEDFTACGSGTNADGKYLCHTDSHSCYKRWTVYGDRPAKDYRGYTGDFYEDDEPVEDVLAAFNRGVKSLTRKPTAPLGEARFMELLAEESERWAGTLALLADYDTWCADPACPSCNERGRRKVEE